ncbi:MAG: sugar ABC transporter substrate-binding protein [Clostridiales bacterium]|nr:sugar ABC transporter substrate-binding protein [Clostridiales bacterium]
MKKFLAILMCVFMLASFAACGSTTTPAADTSAADQPADTAAQPAAETTTETAGGTIYVLGPTPDHGWTAQAGVYAEQKVAEINAEGTYKAVYMAASTGEEQVDQVQTILANNDAVGVVFFALEDSAKAGQEALIAANVPFISFDRIIEGPDQYAILNASGNNWQCGAGIAYWLQMNGMVPGSTLVTLIGDNGTVCSRRQEGFEQFLRGELDYYDKDKNETYHTTQVWTQEEIDTLTAEYKTVCNWSADGAYQYLEQKLSDIVATAKPSGSLYIYSMDDEMTFGLMNLLEANAIDEQTKADFAALNVYTSAIGGMAELYAVIDGTSAQAATAQTYFDGLMSVYFSPKMFENVINYMLDYLSGNWDYKVGDGKYEDVWIVDAGNVANYQGFTGH